MAARSELPTEPVGHELVITRVFDAPPDLVFKVWSDPAHMTRWWGPRDGNRDFTTPSCEMDFRPGGRYRICIRSPDGRDYWQCGRYLEIVEGERLVFTFAWDNPEAVALETVVTVHFTGHGAGKTLLTFRQTGFPSVEQRDGHEGGWAQCLDRLADHLARSDS